jgi:hypothetical protein
MNTLKVFTGSTGLNTLIDPVRLKSSSNGVQPLAEAVNVDICGETGRVSRRKGLRQLAAVSEPHSLWSVQNESACFYIAAGTLYSLNSDGSTNAIVSGLSDDAGSYAEAPGEVFFSNGTAMGRISLDSLTWTNWEAETTPSGQTTDKVFSGPPAGKPICWHKSKMVVAVTQPRQAYLMFSEPFFYNRFDLTRNWVPIPGDDPTMLMSVSTGLYIGTSHGLFFVSGDTMQEMAVRQVSQYQVVPGTEVLAEAQFLGLQMNGTCVVCVLNHLGVCALLPDGNLIPMTYKSVSLDPATAGYGILHSKDNHRYLMFTDN